MSDYHIQSAPQYEHLYPARPGAAASSQMMQANELFPMAQPAEESFQEAATRPAVVEVTQQLVEPAEVPPENPPGMDDDLTLKEFFAQPNTLTVAELPATATNHTDSDDSEHADDYDGPRPNLAPEQRNYASKTDATGKKSNKDFKKV